MDIILHWDILVSACSTHPETSKILQVSQSTWYGEPTSTPQETTEAQVFLASVWFRVASGSRSAVVARPIHRLFKKDVEVCMRSRVRESHESSQSRSEYTSCLDSGRSCTYFQSFYACLHSCEAVVGQMEVKKNACMVRTGHSESNAERKYDAARMECRECPFDHSQ